MEERIYITPEYTAAGEIKRVRKQLGLTQKEFALLFNSSKATGADISITPLVYARAEGMYHY